MSDLVFKLLVTLALRSGIKSTEIASKLAASETVVERWASGIALPAPAMRRVVAESIAYIVARDQTQATRGDLDGAYIQTVVGHVQPGTLRRFG